jgi:cell division protein FtsA
MNNDLFIGIDLGSSRLRFAMGQVSRSEERGPVLSIIGAVEVPSQGIAKGVVNALEDAVTALSAGIERAEQQLGVPIQEATVGISGTHISVIPAKGVVGVSRADGDIRAEDVERVLEATRSAANPANHEILHVLSHGFSVDGQGGVKDPIGMHGIRLEASAHLVLGLAGNVRNMTKCVFRTGLDISSLVFGPLAGAEAVTNPRERELGVCVVNIGASTTSVLVFEEGALLHAAVLPIGADHITSDIAIGLRTGLNAAEAIKQTHGTALPEEVGKNEEIGLTEYGGEPGSGELVSLQYVAQIIEARTEELMEKVEAELQRADRSGLLPAGVVLTGGGAKLHGTAEVAKRILRLPASVGAATHLPTPMPERVHDAAFSTAVGLVQWAFEESRREEDGPSMMKGAGKALRSGNAFAQKAGNMMKKVFKSFIP